VVGSVLVVERPENQAQLRLLFVSKAKLIEEWGKSSTEIRFDLDLRTDDRGSGPRYAD